MFNSPKKYSVSETHSFVEEFKIASIAPGTLSGLSFAVKDIIDIAGYKTGCGNPMWERIQPTAMVNAVCVDQLLGNGAECFGKTVTSEFAFDLIGENAFFPTPLNPKAPDRVPGGSSSGSASAVACGLVDFAIGTDTGGSIRIPANNCGLFGMRPSHDAISLAGVMQLAPTFDTIGFLARSLDVFLKVANSLLALSPIVSQKVRRIYVIEEVMNLVSEDIKEAFYHVLDQIRHSVEAVQHLSIHTIDQEVMHQNLKNWYETFVTIQFSEILNSLETWIETYEIELGAKTKVSYELAKSLDRKKLPSAIQKREYLFRKLNAFLDSRDLICIPTAPSLAPIKGSIGLDRSKGNYYPPLSTLTSIAGIARLPQISLPLCELNGVPVGISLLAAHRNDAFLLDAVEQMFSHHFLHKPEAFIFSK